MPFSAAASTSHFDQAIATKPRECHELDVLHVLALVEVPAAGGATPPLRAPARRAHPGPISFSPWFLPSHAADAKRFAASNCSDHKMLRSRSARTLLEPRDEPQSLARARNDCCQSPTMPFRTNAGMSAGRSLDQRCWLSRMLRKLLCSEDSLAKRGVARGARAAVAEKLGYAHDRVRRIGDHVLVGRKQHVRGFVRRGNHDSKLSK